MGISITNCKLYIQHDTRIEMIQLRPFYRLS